MTHIFCIANQKGGVGKTTTSINLAAALSHLKLQCLLIDLDPQGNATMGSGINKQELDGSIYDVLLGEQPMHRVRVTTESGYDIVGANRDLAAAEVTMVGLARRELRLREALLVDGQHYDFILIDCPPSLNLLTINGLCAAQGVVVPMQCEYFALEGLSDLVNNVRHVRANLNADLQLIGLLRVMFDPRVTLQQQVSNELKLHFGDKVFDAIVPRNVRLAEAPSFGKPGIVFDPFSRGAQAYMQFAQEFVHRVEQGQTPPIKH